MSSTARTPNWDEGLSAQSEITGKNEYVLSRNGKLLTDSSVPPEGATNFATGQVSVGATATSIIASRSTRTSIVITNLGTTDVYIGASAAVSTANGQLLAGIRGASITLEVVSAIFGISATGSQTVSYEEEFN